MRWRRNDRDPMRFGRVPRKHLILALLVVTTVPFPAAASEDPPRVARVEQAYAEWLVPTDRPDHFRWIAVSARNEFPPGGGAPVSTVDVVRGRCTVRISNGEETIMCSGAPREYTLRPKEFSTDPITSTARLTLKTHRFVHSVRWSVEDAASGGAYWEQEDCSGDTGVGAGASRLALAAGRVFGIKLPVENGGRDFAAVDFGALASQC